MNIQVTKEQDKRFIRELLSALRNGTFKQTSWTLQVNQCYCVMGVVCRVAERVFGVVLETDRDGFLIGNAVGEDQQTGVWLATKHLIPSWLQDNLVLMNDVRGHSFEAIADHLERVYMFSEDE